MARMPLRARAVPRGPTPHSLRHAFAVRSLESLDPDADPDRHMLALATYLGHSEVAHTYWYLEATPLLLGGIAEATERAHREGTSDDCRPDIPRFLDHLADTGQIEPWRRALGTHRECFAGFRAWLARTRDISAGRINDHIKQIQAVLPALGEVPESYDAALIRRVMLAHLERGSRSRARVLATSLRMYLRFLAFEGHVPAALVGAVPSVPAWSLSTLPRHIPVEEVERTIESCDTATPHTAHRRPP